MSVLVCGMKMPPSCRYCEFRHMSLTQNAFCTAANETIDYMAERTKRLDNCPLIELPPHGRLIVEDDAIETAWMILAGLGYRREENPQLEQAVREVYATAPTIEVE